MPPSIKSEFGRSPVATIAASLCTLCSIATLLTGLVLATKWTSEMESRIEFNERALSGTVTRTEWTLKGESGDRELESIKASQIRQEAKIDRIYEVLIKSK